MRSARSCKIAPTRVRVWKFPDVVMKKKLSLTQSANQRRALSGRGPVNPPVLVIHAEQAVRQSGAGARSGQGDRSGRSVRLRGRRRGDHPKPGSRQCGDITGACRAGDQPDRKPQAGRPAVVVVRPALVTGVLFPAQRESRGHSGRELHGVCNTRGRLWRTCASPYRPPTAMVTVRHRRQHERGPIRATR